METTDYNKQATDFLNATSTTFKVKFYKHAKYFHEDEYLRDIYKISLIRGEKKHTFTFGQSIENKGIQPSEYDILACITKYDPETFKDFCSEFGYNTNNRNAEKIYKAVCKEWAMVQDLWSEEEIELLREIQ